MKRLLFVLAAAAVSLSPVVYSQTMGQAEEFSAGAIDPNTGASGLVQITVTRWSTPAERQALVSTLLEKGQDALLDKLQDMKPVGRIRTPDSIGYELRYAQQRPAAEGGRDIVIATDRPISFWEAVNRPRTIQYPFTLIQMHIGQNGKGEGKLAIATKITADPDTKTVEIEDYAHQPVRLVDVSAQPRRSN